MVERPDFRPKGGAQSTRPDFRPNAGTTDFSSRTAGMTREQILDEYRKAEINSPYYNHLVKLIEQPQAGETPEQAATRAGGVAPAGAPSAGMSTLGGYADWMTRGLYDEGAATLDWMRGRDYDQSLAKHRQLKTTLEEENPMSYMAGQGLGLGTDIVATLGLTGPMTWLGRATTYPALGAGSEFTHAFNEGEGGFSNRLSDGLSAAPLGAAFGAIFPGAEALWKGGKWLTGKAVKNVQKLSNPSVAAEKDLVERGVSSRRTYDKLQQRAARMGEPMQPRRFLTGEEAEAARAAGQTPMVSDLLGDAGNRRLKAATNVSEDAENLLKGASAQRQLAQEGSAGQQLANAFGDLNPKTLRDELTELARRENEAAYGLVEAHPNAAHMWSPALQRVLSTPEGKSAIKSAITKSRRKAINSGDDIIEPIFEEGQDGLMAWTGKFRKPTGEIADDIEGLGLGFRFWDSVKKSIDDDIGALQRAGRNEEARDLIKTKNQLVDAMDNMLVDAEGNSLYKAARAGAADFFGAADAHDAGAEFFRKMDAFGLAESMDNLKKMKPAARELFARGYAAELIVQTNGDAAKVYGKFKDPQARLKIRAALGRDLADQMEVFSHRAMVQRLLGEHLGANSTTARQILDSEGLKMSATTGGGSLYGYYSTGSLAGALAGAAAGAGFRATQRAVVKRYADALAELAASQDPATIARISEKIAKDSGFREFSEAAIEGLSAAGRGSTTAPQIGAERIEPRMPFADGGRVPLEGGGKAGLAKAAISAITRGWTPGRSTVKHPVRKAFPGVYKDPRELLADVRIEPESPALKHLFGVTRDDLFEISKRKGNVDDILGIKDKPARGSEATDNIKTPRNARRLVDALDAARTNEDLWKGMHGWYVMDPAYQYLVREYGPEEGARLFRRFNTLTGMSSPGSEVMTELQRGTAANMMDNLGLWEEFLTMGGTSKNKRGHNFPKQLKDVDGHPYHSTSQAPAMDTYLRTGNVEMGSAKVPTYIGASTPPELGLFTDLPVADAHFTRAVGLPDTRTAEKVFDHSMTMGEYKAVAPWYRDEVAAQAGIESVPAQAIHWGLFGPQTGVTTPVGSPKLELLARGIMETARRLGISPEKARDLVLTGKAHAYERGGFVSALGAAAH